MNEQTQANGKDVNPAPVQPAGPTSVDRVIAQIESQRNVAMSMNAMLAAERDELAAKLDAALVTISELRAAMSEKIATKAKRR